MNWIKDLFNKKQFIEDKIYESIKDIEYVQISKGWNADPVSPEIILTTEADDLIIDVYLNYYAFENFKKGDKVKIKFKNCVEYSLNTCNDEGYYNGQYRIDPEKLPWGEFYQIKMA